MLEAKDWSITNRKLTIIFLDVSVCIGMERAYKFCPKCLNWNRTMKTAAVSRVFFPILPPLFYFIFFKLTFQIERQGKSIHSAKGKSEETEGKKMVLKGSLHSEKIEDCKKWKSERRRKETEIERVDAACELFFVVAIRPIIILNDDVWSFFGKKIANNSKMFTKNFWALVSLQMVFCKI